jgi:hypothetical protein
MKSERRGNSQKGKEMSDMRIFRGDMKSIEAFMRGRRMAARFDTSLSGSKISS